MAKVEGFDRVNCRRMEEWVRRLWNTAEVAFTDHTVIAMEDEGIDELDVQHVLRFGRIVGHEVIDDLWRYRFHGETTTGSRMGVVVQISGSLIVITVFLR